MRHGKFTQEEVVQDLRKRVEKSTLREVSEALGISPPYLHEVLKGTRNPGPKILEKLGLKKLVEVRIQYERLDARHP